MRSRAEARIRRGAIPVGDRLVGRDDGVLRVWVEPTGEVPLERGERIEPFHFAGKVVSHPLASTR